MTIKLSSESLAAASGTVAVPRYDRNRLSAGILHFGVGNFHRSHQAVYLDVLFNAGHDHDWAILGAGVMAGDERMRAALAPQDWLTTVVEQSADESHGRVTGAMIDVLPIGDTGAIIDRLADPAIRIVSLTVTEGGYFIDAAGAFDPDHPDIRADAKAGDMPKTVFGLIVAGLKRRRAEGTQPFTVMSCDNIPHNGAVARNAVTGMARLIDPALADWIVESVAFPNGMVDRITPATGDREREALARDFGIDDAWPVFCEDFTQWVLEDKFPAGRPALERVGVQFVPDVTPFESMKLRILNGGHAIIAYPAGLMDIEFAHEAMAHPLIIGFLDKVEHDEIIPMVPPVPDTDIERYYGVIRRRFANPKIADTIRRLCLDGSNRQPKFIVPSIADRLAADASVTGLALESALWCRYCYGESDSGRVIEPNDPNWDRLTELAKAARTEPTVWLDMRDVYGDTGANEAFRASFEHALRALWAEGTQGVLRRYLDGTL